MAKRWLQQKRLKQKKHRQKLRRAWAKPFSMRSYAGVSKDAILYGDIGTLGQRARATQSAVTTAPSKTPMSREVFDQPVPQTKKLTLARGHGPNAVPVVEAYIRWQAEVHGQGVDGFNHIVLVHTKSKKLMLFFSGTRWFFVEEDRERLVARRSVIYPSKRRAIKQLDLRKITWVETLSLGQAEISPKIDKPNPLREEPVSDPLKLHKDPLAATDAHVHTYLKRFR